MPRSLRELVSSIALGGTVLLTLATMPTVAAQDVRGSIPSGDVHYLLNAGMPPGALGQARLMGRGAVQGYYQPVEIFVSQGARVALATAEGFLPPSPEPVRAGMLVGAVYRFQISGLPNQPGVELFPTIEIIDRLYPPAGRVADFPIPVHVDRDDLLQALAGRLVTRVIYLEDGQSALPVADEPDTQRSFDVRPDMDPLQEADRLGRPVAVLRIGSRIPPTDSLGYAAFMLGSPPWLSLPPGTATTTTTTP